MAPPNRRALRARRAGAALGSVLLVLSALVLFLVVGDCLPQNGRAGPLPDPAIIGEDVGEDDWLAIGPFVAGSGITEPIDRDWLTDLGGEGRASPLAVQRLEGPAWRFVHAEGSMVFLSELPGAAERATVYAFREVEGSGAAWLEVRASAAIKVFLNGEAVYARYDGSSRYGIEEAVAVELRRGRNRLLVKVAGLAGRRDFGLRLFHPSAPLPGSGAESPASLEGGIAGGTEGVSDDASKGAGPDDYAVRLLSRLVDRGGTLRGILPLRGDPVDAVPEDILSNAGDTVGIGPEVRISAYDREGALLGGTRASHGGGFELALPPDYEGLVLLRVSDGLREKGPVGAFAGDFEAAAAAAARSARAALSTLPVPASGSAGPGGGAEGRAGYDRRATLAFLADLLEGKAGPGLQDLDGALCALEELDLLLGMGDAPLPAGRAFRLARSSPIDDSIQPWCLALPSPSAAASGLPPSPPPLLVALHDLGESDLEAMDRVASLATKGVVVLAPWGRGDSGWAGLGEEDLEEAIAAAGRATMASGLPAPDPRRTWFVGWGWGASAALREARLHPASVAAVAAFSGLPGPDDPAPFNGLPILFVRGAKDGGLLEEEARDAVARLEGAGAQLDYETVAGRDPREAWDSWGAGDAGRLFRFLAGKALPWPPARIELRAPSPRLCAVPGLYLLESIDPAGLSALSLERLDERHLVLSLENVSAFEIDLGALGLASSGRVILKVEDRSWTCDAGSRHHFVLDDQPGPDTRGSYRLVPPNSEEPGLSPSTAWGQSQPPQLGGGFGDLFRSRLLIVYGTKKPSRSAQLKSLAERLSDWAPTSERPFGSAPGRFPVIADRDADAAALEGYNLLLVGGPGENRLAEEFARGLPVAFVPGGVSVDGRDWKVAGLALLCPRPDEAGRLLGLVAPPTGNSAGRAAVESILAPLRADPAASSCATSYRTPDLMLFDSAGKRIWTASFDSRWSKLRSWYE